MTKNKIHDVCPAVLPLQISADGGFMFCGCGNKVQVIEISSGQTKFTVGDVSKYL